jgi:hypothetical protein
VRPSIDIDQVIPIPYGGVIVLIALIGGAVGAALDAVDVGECEAGVTAVVLSTIEVSVGSEGGWSAEVGTTIERDRLVRPRLVWIPLFQAVLKLQSSYCWYPKKYSLHR